MVEVLVEPFRPGSELFDNAVRVYAVTWQRNYDKSRAMMAMFEHYPAYRGLAALDGERVVGMAFGHLSLPGQWWHDRVAAQVGLDHPALQQAWVLVELAVLPPYRSKGIGKGLLGALLERQPFPRTLLSTQLENYRARRFYEAQGWDYLHNGFMFSPGQPPYVVMCRQVRQ